MIDVDLINQYHNNNVSVAKGSHHALWRDKGGVDINSQSVPLGFPTPSPIQSPNQSQEPNAHTATNVPNNAGVSHVSVARSLLCPQIL